ncbi:hypothetical protein QYE76_051903 [Lolium multiflorum]|uniref:Uncharacterized protein n=1 Tax=Lolium multiflorum TaxID=4521 RepID=A0AAD8WIK9_LOLMU|nr:hypothetical protein QYE76_051903 [Lolium multiflorum]
MESMEDGELSWIVVCTLWDSHVANLEEIEIQLFDRTWEEGIVRVMQATLARLVFHHRAELESRASLDSNRMENEVLKSELEGVKEELKLAKFEGCQQRRLKLRVREANYMLKVKVMHLKTSLRETEDKIETLQDEGEDLRKENAALLSDDNFMEDEGYNWYRQDKDENEEDLAFINAELEDPEPLHSEEIVADDEEDPEEPPFKDDTIALDDD